MKYTTKSYQEFKELTDDLSIEEFKKLSPFIRLNCADCKFLKGNISLWCTNDEAIEIRGTKLPAVSNCSCWMPNWDYIDDKYKTSDNGYFEQKQLELEIKKGEALKELTNFLSFNTKVLNFINFSILCFAIWFIVMCFYNYFNQ